MSALMDARVLELQRRSRSLRRIGVAAGAGLVAFALAALDSIGLPMFSA